MLAEKRPHWHDQEEAAKTSDVFQRFVARQPILDRNRATYGYELLFRTSWENRFTGESEAASRRLIDDAVCFGLDSIVGEGAPFINCTHTILVEGLATLLPRDTVLEVLETVQVDDALIAACKRLQSKGYRIALDDFDFSEQWEPLLRIADFIKLDFRTSTPEERKALMQRVTNPRTQFVAEKIEDEAEFRRAKAEGFHLFQGYFFNKPLVLARPALTSIMHRLRLWKELRRPELDTKKILVLLKEEAALSFRLLRFANSALAGARSNVTSLSTAFVMMGADQFCKMALVVLTSEICGNQPPEVYRSILQKARFCELMAPHTDRDATDLYLFGMIAVLKSVLDMSADEVRQLITLPTVLMEALAGADNPYSRILRIGAAFEEARWDDLSSEVLRMNVAETMIAKYWHASTMWADGIVDEALV